MNRENLGNLSANRMNGIQTRHGFLKNHTNFVTTNGCHLGLRQLHQIDLLLASASPEHLVGTHTRDVFIEQPHNAQTQH